MAFLPADYEPVDSRIHKFWNDYPQGRIHTEIVLINETEIVIKASIFADRDDPRPVSIDFAQEKNGKIWLLDMATAGNSYHKPSCPYSGLDKLNEVW